MALIKSKNKADKKSAPEIKEVKPESKKAILTFDEFYSQKQSEMNSNELRHPDWYMLGASPNQYPNSDIKLESPTQAYEKYKKENEK